MGGLIEFQISRSGGLGAQEMVGLREQGIVRCDRRQGPSTRRGVQRIVGAVVAQVSWRADQGELVFAPGSFVPLNSQGESQSTRKRAVEQRPPATTLGHSRCELSRT